MSIARSFSAVNHPLHPTRPGVVGCGGGALSAGLAGEPGVRARPTAIAGWRGYVMRCFCHPENEAVGVCKNCFKGVCPECLIDVGDGLACGSPYQFEVRANNELVLPVP